MLSIFYCCSVSEKQDAVPSHSVYPDAEDRSHVAVQEETQTTVGSTSSPLHCSLLVIEDSGMLSVPTANYFIS